MLPQLRSVAVAALTAFAAVSAHGATGAELFADNCASCHGADGKARTPAGKKFGAKDLSASKTSDAEIAQQIVNGKKNDRGGMPPFKDKLSADDIQALVAYVKAFRATK